VRPASQLPCQPSCLESALGPGPSPAVVKAGRLAVNSDTAVVADWHAASLGS
jgi:hypothetical protein